MLALGVASGLFGGAFPLGSVPSMVATFFAIVCFAGALILWFLGKRRDRYDLHLLQEIHDHEQIREIEVDEDHDYGSVVCPLCQTVYDKRIPACPNCGRAF